MSYRKNLCSTLPYHDGMFEVCSWLTVFCMNSPAVFCVKEYFAAAHSNHWFYGKAQSFLKKNACMASAIVVHLRIFVHLSANAMTGEFPYNAIASLLAIVLHGIANVAKS